MDSSYYIEKKVPSSDGKHELYGRVYLPQGEAKGFFHVVHGMTEHIGRYEAFMREMAQAGYICFGYDHLGHGQTAKDDSELGFIAHKEGWRYMAKDVGIFAEAVLGEYGRHMPYILMGHSMGSFVVRVAVSEGLVHPDRLIVMGTGGPNPAAGVGLALIALIKTFLGERHISSLVQNLAFGAYNKRFSSDGPHGWLTADAAVREKYAGDKFCTFRFTVSAMGDLITLTKKSNAGKWFAHMDKALPILLVSGKDDPVGNYGKGVNVVFNRLRAQGANVRMILYAGRHEILNDACRDAVIRDIQAFAEGKISP